MKFKLLKLADRTDMLRQMKLPEKVIDYLTNAYPTTIDPKMRYIVWLGKQMIELAKKHTGGRDPRKSKSDPEEIQSNRAYDQVKMYPMDPNSIMQVIDWAVQTGPNIMGMTWDDAWRDSSEWHEKLAEDMEREATKSYMDPSKVVFRLSNGWTVNKLEADDCDIEGDLMGHCVGGYARAVAEGRTTIFSLRDPKGGPHATIEIIPETNRVRGQETSMTWNVVQIQGKSNNEPNEEYKEMLREWFESLKEDGVKVEWEYEEDLPEPDYIREWEPPEEGVDEYGITVNRDDSLGHYDWNDMIERAWKESWTHRGDHYIERNAIAGIDAIIDNFEWNIRNKDLEGARNTFKNLESDAYRFQEKANDKWDEWYDMNWEHLPHMPDEDEFIDEEGNFDSEGWNKAEKEYYEEISWYEEDFPWFKFANYLFEQLNKIRERLFPEGEKVGEPEAVPATASWYERSVKTS